MALATCADADHAPPTCNEAVEREEWPAALQACSAELKHKPAPAIALRLAQARFETGDLVGSRELSAPLLAGEGDVAADANQIFGRALAAEETDLAGARRHLERALALHESKGHLPGVARDAVALARVLRDRSEFAGALALQKRAAEAAARVADRRAVFSASLMHADTVREAGDVDEAEREFNEILRDASDPHERAWALFKLGLLHVNMGANALARPRLEEALELAVARSENRLVDGARQNLAFVARQQHRLDEAEALLASVAPGGESYSIHQIRAQIAGERGDFERAAVEFAKAEGALDKDDSYGWVLAMYVGELEERRGRRDAAEAAYRRAIAGVEQIRDGAGSRFVTHVLAARRLPYERLVDLLASTGRWPEVLEVVDSLDLGEIIATAATPRELTNSGEPVRPRGSRTTVVQLGWQRAGAGGDASPAPGVDALLEAWRGRHLVVLMPGGERIWRLEVYEGRLSGADVGSRDELERLAGRLEGEPGDAGAARALGEAMLPPARGEGTIDVLAVGPLGRVPLAALRRGEALAVASTPLARVLGLRALRAPSRPGGGSVVIGDPRGDLPAAAEEARWVAGRVGASARLGPEAGRGAFAASRDADLLHVAAHAAEGPEGAALRLADGDLGAPEIAALTPAARVVVLASCASAASRDGTGWGSLAAAFLVAGAEAVVATQWSVDDGDAANVVKSLYEYGPGLRGDPARALAAAQARLAAGVAPRAWAAFTVVRAPPSVAARR